MAIIYSARAIGSAGGLGALAWGYAPAFLGPFILFSVFDTLLDFKHCFLATFGTVTYEVEAGIWRYTASAGPFHDHLEVELDAEYILQATDFGLILKQFGARYRLIGSNDIQWNFWLIGLLRSVT